MDGPGPRPGSMSPNVRSDHQLERPLPPLPISEPISPPRGYDEEPTNVSREQLQIDLREIYYDDSAVEEPEIHLHGVDGSLLDIYPSRSNSSLSVAALEPLTRAPYLEGVSNNPEGTTRSVNELYAPRGDERESFQSQGEGPSIESNSIPVSLREFLGADPSVQRNNPSLSARSAGASVSNLGETSIVLSREAPGHSQETVWRGAEPESTMYRSARTSRQGRTQTTNPPQRVVSRRGYESSSSEISGDSPLLSHDSPSQIRRSQRAQPPPPQAPSRPDFVVPRWQPDAEVTFCPICRTQFSFFVRKHHCRKCGRVVCNSCSPHRITIPYQYIVQPPVDSGPPTSSGPHPPRRTDTAGSVEVASLGGGERVRLCNPCVPDPNTAPPINTHRPASYSNRHSRSASTNAVSQNTFGGYSQNSGAELDVNPRNFQGRSREASLHGNPNRFEAQSSSALHSQRTDNLLRPDDYQSRSRSSTVGSTRDQNNMGQFPSSMGHGLERSHSIHGHSHYRPLIPTTQSEGMASHTPPIPRLRPTRPQIAEEDECWVCHRELPSRNLPDFQAVRERHVQDCLDSAIAGLSISPSRTSPPITAPRATPPSQAGPSASPAPAQVPNTPEGRSAAREQAHAAVVLGQNRSTPGARFIGVSILPYKASEKDMVEDAECTICLEDFEVGQPMGRLQCLCRFHLHCIRDWFSKQPGRCPLHDHDRGY